MPNPKCPNCNAETTKTLVVLSRRDYYTLFICPNGLNKPIQPKGMNNRSAIIPCSGNTQNQETQESKKVKSPINH